MKDNKNLVIGILVGIIICLIAIFVLYFTGVLKLNGGNNNSNNSNNNTINENTKETEKKKDIFYSYKVENEYNSANSNPFEQNVDVNGKSVLLKYQDNKYTINSKVFDLNGKIYYAVSNFYIYNDIVLVRLNNVDKSIYRIYDLDGNFIKEITEIKESDKYITSYGELSLVGEKLIVDVENENGCGPHIDENAVICGCDQAGSKEYVSSHMNEINNSKYFSKAKYQIVYNKELNSIDLKQIEITETLKQYMDRVSWDLCVVK